jgi:multiple antibiotic resistance protein
LNLVITIEIFVYAFTALFAIMNPLGAIPTLISLTSDYSLDERTRVIKTSVLMAGGMVFGFTLLGVYIFSFLGINIDDFKVAGGLLLFKVAFDMLQGRTSNTKLTKSEEEESEERNAIGVTPIGTPLLAGPGSITTAILINSKEANNLPGQFAMGLGFLLVIVVTYVILMFSFPISKRMGKTGTMVVSRIMGLLLASIAVELITTGIISIILAANL